MEIYRWPGNVRELQRVLSVAVLLACDTIEPEDLPESIRAAGREAQRRVILDLQQRTNITRQELARIFGIDPKTWRPRLKELSIDTP